MSDRVPLLLALELDRGVEPIAGRLRRDDGTTAAFTGWLELTQVLDAVQRDATLPAEEWPGNDNGQY